MPAVVQASVHFMLNRNHRIRAVTTISINKLGWTNMVPYTVLRINTVNDLFKSTSNYTGGMLIALDLFLWRLMRIWILQQRIHIRTCPILRPWSINGYTHTEMAANLRQVRSEHLLFFFSFPKKSFKKPFEFLLYETNIDHFFPCVCVYCNRLSKTSQHVKNKVNA